MPRVRLFIDHLGNVRRSDFRRFIFGLDGAPFVTWLNPIWLGQSPPGIVVADYKGGADRKDQDPGGEDENKIRRRRLLGQALTHRLAIPCS